MFHNIRGFTLMEVLIILLIIAILGPIAISGHKAYERKSLWWGNMIEATPLKNAISQCLKDHSGEIASCNEFTPEKLARYGITAAPKPLSIDGIQPPDSEEYLRSFITMKVRKEDAAIQIVGSKCVVDWIPSPQEPSKWRIAISTPKNSVESVDQCRCIIDIYDDQDSPSFCLFRNMAYLFEPPPQPINFNPTE